MDIFFQNGALCQAIPHSNPLREWACLIAHVAYDAFLSPFVASAPGVTSFNRQRKRRLIPPYKWAVFNGSRAHDGRRSKRLPLLSAARHVFMSFYPLASCVEPPPPCGRCEHQTTAVNDAYNMIYGAYTS